MTELAAFEIGGETVAAGTRRTVDLPVASLYTNTPVHLPVIVQHGTQAGPKLFVSAALHGDEIIGVEIIRRVLRLPQLVQLRGTLMAVPVINVLAFMHQSRYSPDRRDLNRSFPGSESGSLTARLANRFLKEVVGRADYGIDLHTGAIHRPNLPQIRADLSQPENLRLARAFGAPVLLNSAAAGGTLREHTTKQGTPVLLYESSEALRFDETCIRIGVQGVINVMTELGMLPALADAPLRIEPAIAQSSHWVRAPASGILRTQVALGDEVQKDQVLGIVGDPFGEHDTPVLAGTAGLVIGRLNLPLVYEGDALFHIARLKSPEAAAQTVDQIESEAALLPPLPDQPPIV
jgi:predicted deacylase